MSRTPFCILVWFLGTLQPLLVAQGYFRYAGVGLDTSDLKVLFPTSMVQDDQVWVSERDAREHVYYIRRVHRNGRTEIKLVLEKPDEFLAERPQTWEGSHYAKFPECQDLLRVLVKQYGRPSQETSSWEERLKNSFRRWSDGSESLQLWCYQIDGKGKELAAEVLIAQSSDR